MQDAVVSDSRGRQFRLETIHCPICGPDAREKLVGYRGGRHQRWGLGVETKIVRCVDCGLIYPNPFPKALAPQEIYGDPESYFVGHDLPAKVDAYGAIIREIVARTGAAPRLLDVGSGRGEMLLAARREGVLEAVGLELSEAMASYAREHLSVEVHTRTAEHYAASKPKPFDAIVLNAVLEHVYDPDSFVAAVASMTRPGGTLYIDIPREPNLLTMVGNTIERLRMRRAVYNLQPTWEPFHVFGFGPRSLKRLLAKHGFVIESLRVYAAPVVRHRPGDRMDFVRSFTATQVNRLANATGLASNMFVWARKTPG